MMTVEESLSILVEYAEVRISGVIKEGFKVCLLRAEVATIEDDRIKVWPRNDDDLPPEVIDRTGGKLWFDLDKITSLEVIDYNECTPAEEREARRVAGY